MQFVFSKNAFFTASYFVCTKRCNGKMSIELNSWNCSSGHDCHSNFKKRLSHMRVKHTSNFEKKVARKNLSNFFLQASWINMKYFVKKRSKKNIYDHVVNYWRWFGWIKYDSLVQIMKKLRHYFVIISSKSLWNTWKHSGKVPCKIALLPRILRNLNQCLLSFERFVVRDT